MFDAYTKIDNTLLYSIIDSEKACIQGRALPFDSNDIVPLGFKISTNGNYTVAIAVVDGVFTNDQTVYLRDKSLYVIHNLTLNPYSFTSTSGVFNERFEIIYTNGTLGITDFESQEIKVVTNENLTVYSTNDLIKESVVYDLLGRKINHYFNINANEIFLKEQKTNQALILKITLKNRVFVNKKILY